MMRDKNPHKEAHIMKCRVAHNPNGFAYLGTLMVMALGAISMQQVASTWQLQLQREQENELLFIGHQYQQAIKNYYESTPSGTKSYPSDLEELLLDKRFPNTRRHLRQLYRDPFQPTKPWGLIKRGNQIVGIYSTATQKTIKKTGFNLTDKAFENAGAYHEWKFVVQ